MTLSDRIIQEVRNNPTFSNSKIASIVGCGKTSVQKYRNYQHEAILANAVSNKFEENGNEAIGEYKSRQPLSLEEALKKFKVDTEIWIVERYVCNQWEQGAKINNQTQVTPLYQIKIWLKRKVPIAIELPELRPVNIKVSSSGYKTARNNKINTAVIIPDIQCGYRRDLLTNDLDPFHDRKALDVTSQVIDYLEPDRIVYLGDNLDLPEWSDKFFKTREFGSTLQFAAIELAWWLAKSRESCPSAEIDYLEGNHDYRITKAIATFTGEAYGLKPVDDIAGADLLSVERLLGLKSLGIKYHGPYPTGKVWLNENLALVHGEEVKQGSGSTTKALVNDLRHSLGQGHIHRIEMACKTLWTIDGPKSYMAFSPGTLARLDPGVVPAVKNQSNWQQGFAIAQYEPGNGYFDLRIVQIHDGVCIFDGRRWEARSTTKIVDQLSKDTGFKF